MLQTHSHPDCSPASGHRPHFQPEKLAQTDGPGPFRQKAVGPSCESTPAVRPGPTSASLSCVAEACVTYFSREGRRGRV